MVAGPVEAVTEFEARLAGRIPLRRLAANRAFHSALVEPALPRLTDTLATLTVRRPAVAFAANVTGRLFPPDSEIRPRLFVEQARRTVRFGDALASIAEHLPDALVVEVGPGQVLSALAETAGLSVVPLSPSRTAHPADEVLTALGTLWTQGQPLSPRALCDPGHRRVHLPSYPFAGPRWIAPEAAPQTDAARSVQVAGETARAQENARAARPGPIAPQDPTTLHTHPPTNPTPSPETTGETTSAPQTAPTHTARPEPVAPPNPTALLTRLWTELLGHDGLVGHSDFFELGGDSLLATRLARRATQELGVRIPVLDLMTARSLSGQAELVTALTAAN